MFTHKPSVLDQEIDRLVREMSLMQVDSNEYAEAVKKLHTLCEARGIKSPTAISAETILSVAANLIGILLILNFEQTHVVTSKAVTFLFKGNR